MESRRKFSKVEKGGLQQEHSQNSKMYKKNQWNSPTCLKLCWAFIRACFSALHLTVLEEIFTNTATMQKLGPCEFGENGANWKHYFNKYCKLKWSPVETIVGPTNKDAQSPSWFYIYHLLWTKTWRWDTELSDTAFYFQQFAPLC